MSERKKVRILAIGRTGNGKSSLLELLYKGPERKGEELFETSNLSKSKTKHHTTRTKRIDESLTLMLTDTQGVGDTDDSQLVVRQNTINAVRAASVGVDIFFFVIRQNRFVQFEKDAFDFLFNIVFGEKAIANTYIIVTHCQSTRDRDTLKWIAEAKKDKRLAPILKRLDYRIHFIQNPPVIPDNEDEYDDNPSNLRKRKVSYKKLIKLIRNANTTPFSIESLKKQEEKIKKLEKEQAERIKKAKELKEKEAKEMIKVKNEIQILTAKLKEERVNQQKFAKEKEVLQKKLFQQREAEIKMHHEHKIREMKLMNEMKIAEEKRRQAVIAAEKEALRQQNLALEREKKILQSRPITYIDEDDSWCTIS